MVPIPGTKRRTYLEENVGATKVQLIEERPRAHRGSGAEGLRRRRPLSRYEHGERVNQGEGQCRIALRSYVVEFEWDPEKAEGNFRKHRVRFAEAETVFKDEILSDVVRRDGDEERFMDWSWSLREDLVVVYAVRGENIRLISARKATRRRVHENTSTENETRYDFSKAHRGPLVPKDPEQKASYHSARQSCARLSRGNDLDRSGGGSLEKCHQYRIARPCCLV